jgi:hypothetical protein
LVVDLLYITAYSLVAAVLWKAPQLGSPWRELGLGWVALEALFMVFGKWRCACRPATARLQCSYRATYFQRAPKK